jgi:hypothetical protein
MASEMHILVPEYFLRITKQVGTEEGFMRRDDLMKADLLSEIVLISGCAFLLFALILFLAAALTHASPAL